MAPRTAWNPVVLASSYNLMAGALLGESCFAEALQLIDDALVGVACDLPSGVGADDGDLLPDIPNYDLTVAFGALKPAHRLMPAMPRMGRVVLADIGIEAETDWEEIAPPMEMPAARRTAAAADQRSHGTVCQLGWARRSIL